MKLRNRAFIFLSVVIAFIFMGLNIYGGDYKEFQNSLGRKSTLLTSGDVTRQARFTTNGNTVYAEGFFEDEPVTDFYISASNLRGSSQEFKQQDGSFSASYTASCGSSYGYVVLKFQSGYTLSYRIEYNNGWFFGDNGLGDGNIKRVEEYMTADSETSAYYVNEELNISKTRIALDEIRIIAMEITAGEDDDYQKAKLLNYWVAENIYYDEDAFNAGVVPETIALSSVITKRRTVCGGYANLYAAMLEAVGIKAVNVRGGVAADGCIYEELLTKTVVHEWVAFWYENRWVFADPGWDSGNTYSNGEFHYNPHGIKYFDIDSYAFALSHRADKAELREYFSAVEFLQNYTDNDIPESEKPVENQILITEGTSRDAEVSDLQKTDDIEKDRETETEVEEDNGLLIIVIVILIVGVAGVAVVFVKLKR